MGLINLLGFKGCLIYPTYIIVMTLLTRPLVFKHRLLVPSLKLHGGHRLVFQLVLYQIVLLIFEVH